jgi:RNA polymerase sigma-70 factor, ECF subfamily
MRKSIGFHIMDETPIDAEPAGDVTRLLLRWSAGDREAFRDLLPLVYDELKRRAEREMGRERAGHTLQPTALVHEAYLKLVKQASLSVRDRAHFFAVAARAMREVLVDHARRRRSEKHGGQKTMLSIEDVTVSSPPRSIDLLALDLAIGKLADLDERQARLVELRVFGGLTIEESAEVLGFSPATVSRDWRHAEAWLRRELGSAPASRGGVP